MNMDRRYDIDWLRVIAIALLLIYHAAIAFQPWGLMIGFITGNENWEGLWVPMSMLNVWRIPILFFIAGIGMYYSFRNRDWKQLLAERTLRIFVPFVFGFVLLVPVYSYLVQYYYEWPLRYYANSSHLWFLGNIFIYVLLFLPVAWYLKNSVGGTVVTGLTRLMGKPVILLIITLSFISETYAAGPAIYEMYAQTWHGFFLGLLAFSWGYAFALSGRAFWDMLAKWRWPLLILAIVFYAGRILTYQLLPAYVHLPTETCLWIFTLFGFADRYLNRPGKALSYLSKAAYPVYVLHMIWLAVSSMLILPLAIPVYVQFAAILALTFTGCFISYEFIVKRIKVIRPLFGLGKK